MGPRPNQRYPAPRPADDPRRGLADLHPAEDGRHCLNPVYLRPARLGSPLRAEHDHLLAAVAACSGNLTFIVTEHGAPRWDRGIGMWFAEKARDAGVPGSYTAHGLRKRRGVELAEIEATTHQIMSGSGI